MSYRIIGYLLNKIYDIHVKAIYQTRIINILVLINYINSPITLKTE